MPVDDLRKYERIPFRHDIFIGGARCQSIDISAAGIYVAAEYFVTGSLVDITFPYKDKNVSVKGQVQYCHAGLGAGIKFVGLDNDQKAVIGEILTNIKSNAATRHVENNANISPAPLSIERQAAILKALVTLLSRKQIISEEELLSELKKKTTSTPHKSRS